MNYPQTRHYDVQYDSNVPLESTCTAQQLSSHTGLLSSDVKAITYSNPTPSFPNSRLGDERDNGKNKMKYAKSFSLRSTPC